MARSCTQNVTGHSMPVCEAINIFLIERSCPSLESKSTENNVLTLVFGKVLCVVMQYLQPISMKVYTGDADVCHLKKQILDKR